MHKKLMRQGLFTLILLSTQAICGGEVITVSPGLKFGYAFGDKGGFVFGFEISIMRYPNTFPAQNTYGAVLSFESMKREYRLHIGAQTNFTAYEEAWSWFGLEVGPTYIFRETNNTFGINVTPYFGGFIIPYYRLLIIPQEYVQHEVGSFLKLHLQIKGKYSFGG